ncbi:MAG: YbhB/YbcL family Raf kinase inhibitor-like protein [Flavisolibacter sp.]
MQTFKDHATSTATTIEPLKLSCFSFLQNEMIPPRYTADGININPCIYIEGVPEEAKSLAVILEDPDVPHDSFCHWVAWNIPVSNHIKEKENRGVFGINDFGNHCYNGPHPFSIVHRYFFRVYALDCELNISISSTKAELKTAIKGHVVGAGTLVGKYKKKELPQRNNLSAKINQIRTEEWKALLNEKGTCVSLVLPLHNLSQDQLTDKYFLQKAIKQVCTQLSKECDGNNQIINSFRKLQEEISIHPSDKGIGIYVSNDMSLYTGFPFEVTEKIIINSRFHLKDILVKEQYSSHYYVLYIDDKEIRLYSGKLNQLAEVKNKDLPMFFEEELEDPSLINSFFARNSYTRSFDKTMNEIVKLRHQNLIHKADELLHSYLENTEALILCGTRKYLSEFMNNTKHADKVISILYGNYNRFTELDFSDMVWPILRTHIEQEMTNEIADYDFKMGEGTTEEGINRVWDAILSDRGQTLLLEKNFEIEGYVVEQEPTRLYLHPPQIPYSVLPDAVDELIKIALNKDVKIVFVEDTMLNRHMRIALVTKF